MLSRKKNNPPPNFSFVTVEYKAKETNWLKIYSGAARSQAAYWGGPAKYERQVKQNIAQQQASIMTSVFDNDKDSAPIAHGRKSSKMINANAVKLQPCVRAQSPRLIKPNNLQYLPSLPSEIRSMCSAFAADVLTLEFCGEGFVREFVMFDHEDSPIMFSAFILLSYAHSMALTGRGSKNVLLELKGQVLRRLSAKMKSSDGFLSPRCLTVVLALGSPVVCLVSQDLPRRLSIREYINTELDGKLLCCSLESAEKARNALEEQVVHRHAMRRILSKSNGNIQDVKSLALLKYLSNCVRISMATEPAHYMNGQPEDFGDLFPATTPRQHCSIPANWTSPLTCQWIFRNSTVHLESQMLLLAGLTHRWFATFIDDDGRELKSTQNVLEERESLRWQIELFEPATRGSNTELEAMYECCRWASLMLLAVERLCAPMHIAAKHMRIRPSLTKRLRTTNLSNLWGTYRGLLFWVATICHFAFAERCFALLITTLFARFTQEAATLDCFSDITITPLKRLKQFESLCCRLESWNQDIVIHSRIPTRD